MGFLKRLLGLEVKPGEPEPLNENNILQHIQASAGKPVIIYFYHLWCSSCQVMGGLLNEVGPDYVERIKLYKLDINKNPNAAGKFGISSVPTIVTIRDGNITGRRIGLFPIDELREWIDNQISGVDTT